MTKAARMWQAVAVPIMALVSAWLLGFACGLLAALFLSGWRLATGWLL